MLDDTVAVQVTFWMPPGNPPAGTGRATPAMKSFPDVFGGATVDHWPALKLVVADVAPGCKVMVESGAATL
jgi:hypothetical protein